MQTWHNYWRVKTDFVVSCCSLKQRTRDKVLFTSTKFAPKFGGGAVKLWWLCHFSAAIHFMPETKIQNFFGCWFRQVPPGLERMVEKAKANSNLRATLTMRSLWNSAPQDSWTQWAGQSFWSVFGGPVKTTVSPTLARLGSVIWNPRPDLDLNPGSLWIWIYYLRN